MIAGGGKVYPIIVTFHNNAIIIIIKKNALYWNVNIFGQRPGYCQQCIIIIIIIIMSIIFSVYVAYVMAESTSAVKDGQDVVRLSS